MKPVDSRRLHIFPSEIVITVLRTLNRHLVKQLQEHIVTDFSVYTALSKEYIESLTELSRRSNYYVIKTQAITDLNITTYFTGNIYNGVLIYSDVDMKASSILPLWANCFRYCSPKTQILRTNGLFINSYDLTELTRTLANMSSSVFAKLLIPYANNRQVNGIINTIKESTIYERGVPTKLIKFNSERHYITSSGFASKFEDDEIFSTVSLRGISLSKNKMTFVHQMFSLYTDLNLNRNCFQIVSDNNMLPSFLSSNYVHPSVRMIYTRIPEDAASFLFTTKKVAALVLDNAPNVNSVLSEDNLIIKYRCTTDTRNKESRLMGSLIPKITPTEVYKENGVCLGLRFNNHIIVGGHLSLDNNSWTETMHCMWVIFNLLEYNSQEIKNKFLSMIKQKLYSMELKTVINVSINSIKEELGRARNRLQIASTELIRISKDAQTKEVVYNTARKNATESLNNLRTLGHSNLHRFIKMFNVNLTEFMLIETRPFTFSSKVSGYYGPYVLPGYRIAIPLPTVSKPYEAYNQAFTSIPFILKIAPQYAAYEKYLEDTTGIKTYRHHPHCSERITPHDGNVIPGMNLTLEAAIIIASQMGVLRTVKDADISTICLGEIAPSFFQAISSLDFKGLLQCILSFVYTGINVSDPWGRTVQKFLITKDKELIELLSFNNKWSDEQWNTPIVFEPVYSTIDPTKTITLNTIWQKV